MENNITLIYSYIFKISTRVSILFYCVSILIHGHFLTDKTSMIRQGKVTTIELSHAWMLSYKDSVESVKTFVISFK